MQLIIITTRDRSEPVGLHSRREYLKARFGVYSRYPAAERGQEVKSVYLISDQRKCTVEIMLLFRCFHLSFIMAWTSTSVA